MNVPGRIQPSKPWPRTQREENLVKTHIQERCGGKAMSDFSRGFKESFMFLMPSSLPKLHDFGIIAGALCYWAIFGAVIIGGMWLVLS